MLAVTRLPSATTPGSVANLLSSRTSSATALVAGAPEPMATPILAAGILKLPSLAGTAGAHIHGQVILGVVVTAITAYLSVRYLVRYFQTRTLTPFAIYCLVFGGLSIIHFAL